MRKDADWFDVDDVGENWRHENSKTHKKICSNFELTEWDIFIHSVWTVFDVVLQEIQKVSSGNCHNSTNITQMKKNARRKS